MKHLILLLALLGASCSKEAVSSHAKEAARVRLDHRNNDKRCSDPVTTDLRPNQFDYGVVSSPTIAKDMASAYFRAIFTGSDFPADEVLKRPLVARLKNGVWRVETTLPEGAIGVYFAAEICQSNGRVLYLNGFQ